MTTADVSIPNGSPPELWKADLGAVMSGAERLLSWLELDLDERLQFSSGLLAVTDRRLLVKIAGAAEWREWSYRRGLALRHHDHGGVGTLELHDERARLGRWRYTLGRHSAAIRWVDRFEEQIGSHGAWRPVMREAEPACPRCAAPLDPGQDDCPNCARELHSPPSTWTLLRLSRFAKPYKLQL